MLNTKKIDKNAAKLGILILIKKEKQRNLLLKEKVKKVQAAQGANCRTGREKKCQIYKIKLKYKRPLYIQ